MTGYYNTADAQDYNRDLAIKAGMDFPHPP